MKMPKLLHSLQYIYRETVLLGGVGHLATSGACGAIIGGFVYHSVSHAPLAPPYAPLEKKADSLGFLQKKWRKAHVAQFAGSSSTCLLKISFSGRFLFSYLLAPLCHLENKGMENLIFTGAVFLNRPIAICVP